VEIDVVAPVSGLSTLLAGLLLALLSDLAVLWVVIAIGIATTLIVVFDSFATIWPIEIAEFDFTLDPNSDLLNPLYDRDVAFLVIEDQ